VDALSRPALQLAERIRSGKEQPSAALRAHIASDTASPDIVRVCLVEAYDKRYAVFHDRASPRKIIGKLPDDDGLGRLALTWLWTDDNRWAGLMNSKNQLRTALCYYLCAEGLEHYIRSRLETAWLPQQDVQISPKEQHVWRGRLFGNLVSAKLGLTMPNGSLEPALETFIWAYGRKSSSKAAPQALERMSLIPAVGTLMNAV